MQVELTALLDRLPLVLSISAMAFAFFANRRKDVDQRFEALTGRVDRIDKRLTTCEQEIRNLPGKEDVHALQMTLAELRGELKGMSATMSAMSESIKRTESIVTRHEDHLRENS